MIEIHRVSTKDDLLQITYELQSEKWETLEHSADTKALTSFLSSTHNYLLLAYKDSQVIGMLTAHRLDKLDARKCEFLLYEIEVKAGHRGKGVGKALIDSLKVHARDEGVHEIWVLTNQDNESAKSLYGSVTDKKPSSELMYTIEL